MTTHKDQEDELAITVLPDIFRGIGPGDDVVVSAEKVLAWRDKAVSQVLDNVEESVKQHTVPEGRDLVTRSYVMNTIEFERQRLVASKKVDKQ
jgi:hypothetical protein